jgi:hypothetical protein
MILCIAYLTTADQSVNSVMISRELSYYIISQILLYNSVRVNKMPMSTRYYFSIMNIDANFLNRVNHLLFLLMSEVIISSSEQHKHYEKI